MRVNFAAAGVPTRAAKRLKAQLTVKESLARAATAYVLGYRDWHELEASLGQAESSPFDEDCDATTLRRRRDYQASRLAEFASRAQWELDAPEVVSRWQPSAARPQERVAPNGAPQQGHLDADLRMLHRLQELAQLENDPTRLASRAADMLPELVELLRYVSRPVVFRVLSSVAGMLIESPSPKSKVDGRALLEALAAREHAPAMLNLATALRLGDGGAPDGRLQVTRPATATAHRFGPAP